VVQLWPGREHVGSLCPQNQQQRRLFAGQGIQSQPIHLSNQRKPAVAALANGQYVIVWISEQERFYNSVDVYARIFTAAGAPVTDEIAVNSGTNPCDTPDVAPLNDGGFTVVWAQKDLEVATNSWDVWGRAFTASGSPEVADFRINTYLFGDQYRPKIAAGPSGSMVVWTSMGQDGSREGVYGRFLQGGIAVSGSEMQVNTTVISQQIHPAVAWNGVNNFMVVWTSFVGASGFDLYGQAYALNTSP
jgi:large repetitive protein